jgi:Tol biopolymer transport system component
VTVWSVADGSERDVHAGFIERPEWSPDGRTLLGWGTDRNNGYGIYRIDVATGAVSVVSQPQANVFAAFRPSWTGDGKGMYFTAGGQGPQNQRVMLKNLATGEDAEVIRAAPGAVVSPDGRQVAYLSNLTKQGGRQALMVGPVGGGEPREVYGVTPPVAIRRNVLQRDAAQWTADGRGLLVIRVRNGRPEVVRVDVQSGSVVDTGVSAEGLDSFCLSRDGSAIAFSAGRDKIELWALENFLPAATKK